MPVHDIGSRLQFPDGHMEGGRIGRVHHGLARGDGAAFGRGHGNSREGGHDVLGEAQRQLARRALDGRADARRGVIEEGVRPGRRGEGGNESGGRS